MPGPGRFALLLALAWPATAGAALAQPPHTRPPQPRSFEASLTTTSVWRNAGRGFNVTATLRPLGNGLFAARIGGHAGDCLMEAEGMAAESPPGRLALLAGDGPEICRIGFERVGDTQLAVTDESRACAAYHGARCSFVGRLTRVAR